jgi:hypothetical protein
VRRYDKHQAIDPSKNINKDLLDIGRGKQSTL